MDSCHFLLIQIITKLQIYRTNKIGIAQLDQAQVIMKILGEQPFTLILLRNYPTCTQMWPLLLILGVIFLHDQNIEQLEEIQIRMERIQSWDIRYLCL